jgi:hypothetical protein
MGLLLRLIISTPVRLEPGVTDTYSFKSPRNGCEREYNGTCSLQPDLRILLSFLLSVQFSSNSPPILLGKREEHVVICESALGTKLAFPWYRQQRDAMI